MKKVIQHKQIGNRIHYNGIEIFADINVHETVFSFVENKKRDSKIIILGSGGGSFDKRLIDNGFFDITSVDIYSTQYDLQETNFFTYNLNENFGNIGKFDIVICVEVIEHIENTYHFVRNLQKLLKDNNSKIILSTPNIHNSLSKLSFIKNNFLGGFNNKDLYDTGHINPIIEHLFVYALDCSNLKIINKTFNKKVYCGYKGVTFLVYYVFTKVLKIFFGTEEGTISVYEIGKK